MRDAELLLVAREVRQRGGPTIVAGDLNDVAWSETTRMFQSISGLLDPRVGRGFYNTYNAHNPFLRWPLDYVFFSTDFSLVEMKRLGHFGSDHFAIVIELSLSPPKTPRNRPAPANGETELKATETIMNGRHDASSGIVGDD